MVWALKNFVSAGATALIWSAVTALPVPASAEATPTNAENPELEADGSVIPYVNALFPAASAICPHDTRLPSQPRRWVADLVSPSTTGEVMIFTWLPRRLFASGTDWR